MYPMQMDQGQVGVAMTVDPKAFPKISSNAKAQALLNACSAAFAWGGTVGMDKSAENPPGLSSFSDSNERDLVKAAALSGQATENASKSVRWTTKQQDEYAAAYGQAIATGLEDSLAGRPANTDYRGPASIDVLWAHNLPAMYSSAYYVYGSGPSMAGGTPQEESASSMGTNLLIGIGVSLLIAGGLYWTHKKNVFKTHEAAENPSEMKLYQIDDNDESTTLEEFLSLNQNLDPDDVEKIKSLGVEETGHFGGGAMAEWKIRRVY